MRVSVRRGTEGIRFSGTGVRSGLSSERSFRVSLRIPDCPGTQRFSCLCLWRIGIKGVLHHQLAAVKSLNAEPSLHPLCPFLKVLISVKQRVSDLCLAYRSEVDITKFSSVEKQSMCFESK